MRPWLALAGAGFLLIGAGGLVALVLIPAPSVTQQLTSEDSGVPALPDSTVSFHLASTNISHGTLSVRWSSSAPLRAELEIPGCPPPGSACATVLHVWPSNASGSYVSSGPLAASYVLLITTPPKEWANVSVASAATWVVHPPIALGQILAEVACGLLAAVGAVGLFLGLFLRGGFREPRRPISRTADDAEAVAAATGPRTGRSADGSGPPRREPPSRSA